MEILYSIFIIKFTNTFIKTAFIRKWCLRQGRQTKKNWNLDRKAFQEEGKNKGTLPSGRDDDGHRRYDGRDDDGHWRYDGRDDDGHRRYEKHLRGWCNGRGRAGGSRPRGWKSCTPLRPLWSSVLKATGSHWEFYPNGDIIRFAFFFKQVISDTNKL